MSISEIEKSSSAKITLKNARVIVDNDAAFDSKLAIIEKANSRLRLVYYIYQDDYSSSYLTQKLIEKARSGVKVQLLVDYLTNLKKMPLFDYMKRSGGDNMDIRFYGMPTDGIIRDTAFMTMPCPANQKPEAKECYEFKKSTMAKLGIQGRQQTYFSKMLLTGIYGKSGDLIISSLFVGGGIDPAKYKQGAPSSEAEIEALKEFMKLLYEATVKDSLIAKIKVRFALQMYGDTLNPIMNELTGRLPLIQGPNSAAQDWDHITDYTHHKLIMADNNNFQLGGRNIEDSYHMKSNELSSKYTFLDTDFAAVVESGGDEIAKAYDRLFNFSPMVASFDQVNLETPYDLLLNAKLIKQKVFECAYQKPESQEKLIECAVEQVKNDPTYVTKEKAFEAQVSKIQNGTEIYKKYMLTKSYKDTWKPAAKYDDQLSVEDIFRINQSGVAAYIENLSFNKDSKTPKRLYGSVFEAEDKNGKYLHSLWFQGMQNACAESQTTGQHKIVTLHTAYLLPPAGMMKVFGQMMDGSMDCSKVKVNMITNSILTTDLFPINVLAQYQLKGLFRVYDKRESWFGSESNSKAAQFEIFEYKPDQSAKNGVSLHSKVSILGDDVIIGSANSDVRSYYMDTNNGIYLRGATDFVKDYNLWMSKKTPALENKTNFYKNISAGELRQHNQKMAESLLAKYSKGGKSKINPKWAVIGLDALDRVGASIEETTRQTIGSDLYQLKPTEQIEVMRKFDDKFKLF